MSVFFYKCTLKTIDESHFFLHISNESLCLYNLNLTNICSRRSYIFYSHQLFYFLILYILHIFFFKSWSNQIDHCGLKDRLVDWLNKPGWALRTGMHLHMHTHTHAYILITFSMRAWVCVCACVCFLTWSCSRPNLFCMINRSKKGFFCIVSFPFTNRLYSIHVHIKIVLYHNY